MRLALIGLLLVVGAACQPERVVFTGNVTSGARDVCHQEVRKQLKAPSQASFEPTGSFKVMSQVASKWVTSGWVDAPNSFNAKIRTTYSCFATYLGKDRWRTTAQLADDDGF